MIYPAGFSSMCVVSPILYVVVFFPVSLPAIYSSAVVINTVMDTGQSREILLGEREGGGEEREREREGEGRRERGKRGREREGEGGRERERGEGGKEGERRGRERESE